MNTWTFYLVVAVHGERRDSTVSKQENTTAYAKGKNIPSYLV